MDDDNITVTIIKKENNSMKNFVYVSKGASKFYLREQILSNGFKLQCTLNESIVNGLFGKAKAIETCDKNWYTIKKF